MTVRLLDWTKQIDKWAKQTAKHLERVSRSGDRMASLALDQQLQNFRAQHRDGSMPLAGYSERSFSQNGEDGIVSEIFRRLQRPVRTFVEIGAGDGTQNNTIRWLLDGARGLWIEGHGPHVEAIGRLHAEAIKSGRLVARQSYVTAENINDTIRQAGFSGDIDLLSLDIDGNDYWVWKTLDAVDPTVMVLEFNGRFGSSLSWVMKYDPDFRWPGGTSYYGASLKALEKLGRSKSYTLVGVDFLGVNAFFVKDSLLGDGLFPGPYSSEALFQPFRRTLGELPTGKAPVFGPYESP